jgi:hypothetical protein
LLFSSSSGLPDNPKESFSVGGKITTFTRESPRAMLTGSSTVRFEYR